MTTTLTPKQNQYISEILRQLDATKPPPAVSRRKQNRLSLRLPLDATLLNNPTFPTQEIFTRNLTSSGLGFLSRREFRILDWLVIHLKVPSKPIRLLLGQVIFCRYLRSGLYEVGLEFREVSKEGTSKIPIAWARKAIAPAVSEESSPISNN